MDVVDSIIRHEGFKARPYIDPLAHTKVPNEVYEVVKRYWSALTPTFGHGLTYITEDESRAIVANRVRQLRDELSKELPWFSEAPAPVQDVLVEMAYQLGVTGVRKFKNTLAYLAGDNYAAAADEMLNSLWATQTPRRARELADRIRALA